MIEPRAAAFAIVGTLAVLAVGYALLSPDPENNLAAFQQANPNYANDAAAYQANLTFQQGWLGRGCEIFTDSDWENFGLAVIQWTPFAPVAEVRHIYRGFQGMAGAEACLSKYSADFAAGVMSLDPKQPVPEGAAVAAANMCGIHKAHGQRTDEITEGIIGLGASKFTRWGGKAIRGVLESASGKDLPLADELAEKWLVKGAAALTPNPPAHDHFQEKSCQLAAALAPNWGNDFRESSKQFWAELQMGW